MDNKDTKKRKIESDTKTNEVIFEDKTFGIMRKFIERLGFDEVLDFVTDLAMKHDWIHEHIKDKIDRKKELRKVFVRSIPYETTEEAFREALAVHGEVEDCHIIRDADTNRPKGFGFCIYKSYCASMKAIAAGRVEINDRTAYIHFAVYNFRDEEEQKYVPKETSVKRESTERQDAESQKRDKQIFVRGFGDSLTEDDLHRGFEQYGRIEECFIPREKVSGKSKGYGFVKFFALDSAIKAMEQQTKDLNGVKVICDYSNHKKKPSTSNAFDPIALQNLALSQHRLIYSPAFAQERPQQLAYLANPMLSAGMRPYEHTLSAMEPVAVGDLSGQNGLQMQLQQLQLAQAQLVQKIGSSYSEQDAVSYAQQQANLSPYQKNVFYDSMETSRAQNMSGASLENNFGYSLGNGAMRAEQSQNKKRYYAAENSVLNNGMNLEK